MKNMAPMPLILFLVFVLIDAQRKPPHQHKRNGHFPSSIHASRRNLAAGIHQMMGGEVAVGAGPWKEFDFEFTSSPFKPRQYTGTGTEFIHYKNATEQDAAGETTFPPSKSPIAQYTGWFSPTESPSRVPTKYPAADPTGDVSQPTTAPTRKLMKYPTMSPSHKSNWPTRLPSRHPSMVPTHEPTIGVRK